MYRGLSMGGSILSICHSLKPVGVRKVTVQIPVLDLSLKGVKASAQQLHRDFFSLTSCSLLCCNIRDSVSFLLGLYPSSVEAEPSSAPHSTMHRAQCFLHLFLSPHSLESSSQGKTSQEAEALQTLGSLKNIPKSHLQETEAECFRPGYLIFWSY